MNSLMISRIIIRGYRCFSSLNFEPNAGMNIIVGDNEAGKSTILEAIALAMTGRVNGQWASEELNPFWFKQEQVEQYFTDLALGQTVSAPEIEIEIYLSNEAGFARFRGVHNSRREDAPGIRVHVAPSPDYAPEFAAYVADDPPHILPVEFYDIDWRTFADEKLTQRPRELTVAQIDSRTIRSTSGVDYHTREMLSAHLDSRERAIVSLAHRRSRQNITDEALQPINDRIAADNAHLHDRPIGLQMDQSARMSWEGGVVPAVDNIPFAMAGQGQQATLKVALAMNRTAGSTAFVLIEEPENHLSHTTLMRLVRRIEDIANDEQQIFITTHNSFVLNRLGLDRLLLLGNEVITKLTTLEADTTRYFRKLSGYDTLRLVLARKLVLVEGPTDELILERALIDATSKTPNDQGIDIVSMGGLTFKRALAICASLNRQVLALQDNDGRQTADIQTEVHQYLEPDVRELIVSDPANGPTIEPQIIASNDEATLRTILHIRADADLPTWMKNNKTEGALRILDAQTSIAYPSYIVEAVEKLR